MYQRSISYLFLYAGELEKVKGQNQINLWCFRSDWRPLERTCHCVRLLFLPFTIWRLLSISTCNGKLLARRGEGGGQGPLDFLLPEGPPKATFCSCYTTVSCHYKKPFENLLTSDTDAGLERVLPCYYYPQWVAWLDGIFKSSSSFLLAAEHCSLVFPVSIKKK